MICPKSESENVKIQVVNEVHMKKAHHGCLWWLFIGCLWIPCKWLFFTIPAIIFKIFGHKKQNAFNKKKSVCVCQDCGYNWNI